MLGPRLLGVVCILSLFACIGLARADSVEGRSPPPALSRHILALYDGADEKPVDTRIRRWAKAPLNHLGYVLTFRDVRETLPGADELDGYSAVLTWFAVPVELPGAYLEWAARTARSGVKFIILGEIGGRFWTKDLATINDLLEQIGLRHLGRFVDIAFDSSFSKRPPAFEAALDPVPPPYPVLAPVGSDVETLTELVVPFREGGGRSAVAVVGSHGGFVASGFEMMVEPRLDRVRWLIDPFAFFGAILDTGEWPRPDVTSQSGRRVFFTFVEIDQADGTVPNVDRPPLDAVLRKVVAPHPAIPVTLSFDPQQFGARSHDDAANRKMLGDLLAQSQVNGAIRPNFCRAPKGFFEGKKSCLALSDFEEGGKEAPPSGRRGVGVEKWDVALSDLLRPGANAPDNRNSLGLIQVTSETPWSAAAETAAQRLGVRPIELIPNLTSTSYPSIAYVVPLTRPSAGGPIVALPGDAASRDAKMGMRFLVETEARLESTENPERLAPLFWRFHANWLDDPDLAERIETKLRQFESADVKPVAVSDYGATVDDFAHCEVTPIGPALWRVSKLGSLHNFRFDAADKLELDLSRSDGVLGARRHGHSLYISVNSARTEAVIAMRDAAPPPGIVGLEDSRWSVFNLQRQPCGWTFSAAGFGAGDFNWYDVPAGYYNLSTTAENGKAWSTTIQTDASHRLTFSIPLQTRGRTDYTVRCNSQSAAPAP